MARWGTWSGYFRTGRKKSKIFTINEISIA